MLVSDNEFGAPWNDQFYNVKHIVVDTAEPATDVMILPGPRKYSEQDLYEEAMKEFPNSLIIDISCDSWTHHT